MDNKNIHKNYEQGEIRDFLAQEVVETRRIDTLIAPTKYIEQEIKRLGIALKIAKKRDAILLLIKEKNWIEWDISEYVPYYKETYFPFIGTEKEYNKLVKKLSDSEEGDEQ